jgi:hypothetical protein
MADIGFSTANGGNAVKPIDPDQAELLDGLLPSATPPTNGQAVYFHATTGRLTASSAGATGTAKMAGLLVQNNGRAGTYIVRGRVGGFNLSGLDYGASVYLSNTAGKLADSAGTTSVKVGVVVPMSDHDSTKVLFVNAPELA